MRCTLHVPAGRHAYLEGIVLLFHTDAADLCAIVRQRSPNRNIDLNRKGFQDQDEFPSDNVSSDLNGGIVRLCSAVLV